MRRLAFLALLALGACNKPAAEPPPSRPVLWVKVSQTDVDPLSLAGTVQAQVDTPFSFRVLGRLTTRPVNIGDLVRKDQTLAAIDPIALQLGVRSAEADLASAQAQVANALGVADRQATLLKTSSTTQAQVDLAEQSRSGARGWWWRSPFRWCWRSRFWSCRSPIFRCNAFRWARSSSRWTLINPLILGDPKVWVKVLF